MAGVIKNEMGNRYGRLIVIKQDGFKYGRFASWKCKCNCGNIKSIAGQSLRSGKTNSCGCLNREIKRVQAISLNFKHGDTSGFIWSKEYIVWHGMLQRCNNPNNKDYKHYGGRGIRVCERWLHSFRNFLNDMGRKPSSEYSIERMNNDFGYGPSNCCWATRKKQGHNRRTCRNITFSGKTQILKEWAHELQISPTTLDYRLKKWQIGKALTTKKEA